MRIIDWMFALAGVVFISITCEKPNEVDSMNAYFIGNSLTRNIPLEKLQNLFEYQGIEYSYGTQLGGGHQLDQHLSKRNHGNKPGEGKYNTVEPYGEYDHAFKNYKFDAVILQPYNSELDKAAQITDHWPYFESGAIQAASGFIDYAMGKTKAGAGAWHFEHPNTKHKAANQFYIYATWPRIPQMLDSTNTTSYSDFYYQEYNGGAFHCKGYFDNLVSSLNALHPELKQPVKLIPAGEVLAELDLKIRNGELPGIENFYHRNQSYYKQARRNNKNAPGFNPDTFIRDAGVMNFYADNVHMNDQPHNGDGSGTIGSYCAALTVYAVLSRQSPVGMTAEPYEMFDYQNDIKLIHAIQQIVWEVVISNPLTGVRN